VEDRWPVVGQQVELGEDLGYPLAVLQAGRLQQGRIGKSVAGLVIGQGLIKSFEDTTKDNSGPAADLG
jgi:hypothetical protein